METTRPFHIMISDPVLRRALAALTPQHPDMAEWVFVETEEKADIRIDPLDQPVRLGALLDWLSARAQDHADQMPEQMSFGEGVWHPNQSCYARGPGADPVPLRGRENDLLKYLWRASEHKLSRDQILDKVWGYAPGLETHTLETHIYRLRQKIEDDPAAPKILVTTPGGYQLVIGG